jgi:hypothetical protein
MAAFQGSPIPGDIGDHHRHPRGQFKGVPSGWEEFSAGEPIRYKFLLDGQEILTIRGYLGLEHLESAGPRCESEYWLTEITREGSLEAFP